MRYFFRTKNDNTPIVVCRFDAKAGIEQSWSTDETQTEWKKTNRVTDWLVIGEGWLDEVNEETAKKFFPNAFRN